MNRWTHEIVNEHSQANWLVVSSFFLKEMNKKKFLCVVTEKHKVDFFYMGANTICKQAIK